MMFRPDGLALFPAHLGGSVRGAGRSGKPSGRGGSERRRREVA
jgi:hypothetical protein